MKVIMISGSPHKEGSSRLALREMEKVFAAEGIESELIEVGAGPVSGCTACGACKKTRRLRHRRQGERGHRKARRCGRTRRRHPCALRLSCGRSPRLPGQDVYAGGSKFAHKPAAAFASARRAGTTASLDVINKYFTISQMPIISSTYWNMVYGSCQADAAQDAEGLQTARNLARNMAWLLRCIEAGKKSGIEPPKSERGNVTNFIK